MRRLFRDDEIPGGDGEAGIFSAEDLLFGDPAVCLSEDPPAGRKKYPEKKAMDPFFGKDICTSAGKTTGSEPGAVRFHE